MVDTQGDETKKTSMPPLASLPRSILHGTRPDSWKFVQDATTTWERFGSDIFLGKLILKNP